MRPYRPGLKNIARRLRRDATVPERLLWSRLRRKQLGVRFLRQRPIGEYVADFYCPERGPVVEVDGRSHEGRGHEDAVRQSGLERQGLTVLRFTNDEVLRDLDETVRALSNWLEDNAREAETL